MSRVLLVTWLVLALLAASACNREERLNQWLEGITPGTDLTVPKPATITEAPIDLDSDPQAQDLLRLLDQAVQENLAGDAFEDLP